MSNEAITNVSYNRWDYDSRKVAYTQQAEISKAETLYQDALKDKDEFFAHRMWYQLMRLKFYSAERASVIDYFMQTEATQPRTGLYYRGMHYVAGAYIAQVRAAVRPEKRVAHGSGGTYRGECEFSA